MPLFGEKMNCKYNTNMAKLGAGTGNGFFKHTHTPQDCSDQSVGLDPTSFSVSEKTTQKDCTGGSWDLPEKKPWAKEGWGKERNWVARSFKTGWIWTLKYTQRHQEGWSHIADSSRVTAMASLLSVTSGKLFSFKIGWWNLRRLCMCKFSDW